MSLEDRARPALKSALAALAPALGLKSSSIDVLVRDLSDGVSQDSFGGFWLNGTGRDLAQHITETIRPARPDLFDPAPSRSTGGSAPLGRSAARTTAERRAAASAALARVNGDKGPQL